MRPSMVITLLLAALLTAQEQDWLIGRWTCDQDGADVTLQLAADGTLTLYIPGQEPSLARWKRVGDDSLDVISDAITVHYGLFPFGDGEGFVLMGGDLEVDLVFGRANATPLPQGTPTTPAEPAAGAPHPALEGPPLGATGLPLVGYYESDNGLGLVFKLGLFPDGRYHSEMQMEETMVWERGRVVVDAQAITFHPIGSASLRAPYEQSGEQLSVQLGVDFTLVYTRLEKERATLEQYQAETDAAKAEEDATWAARFAIGAPQPRRNQALGEIPRDPQPGKVFEDATVFTSAQGYQWLSSSQYVDPKRPDLPPEYDATRWHFLHDGRFFVVQIVHSANSRTEGWGCYTIDGDRLSFLSDAGERAELRLLDGRRSLLWGETLYGNGVWEEANLRGQ